MNRKETIEVLGTIKVVYPNAYKQMKAADANALLKVWEMAFKENEKEEVTDSVMYFINNDEKGFPPVPGQIKAIIKRKSEFSQGKLLAVDAWQLVLKAMRNSGTQSVQEFNKLPLDVQRAVGSPVQLKQWALNGDMQQLEYIRSNFCKNFETVSETIVEQHNMGVDDQGFLDIVKEKAAQLEGKTEAPKGQEMDSSEWMRKIRELKENLGRA